MPLATATPASAATPSDCSHSWGDYSDVKTTIVGTNVNYRTGPHTSCRAVGAWSNRAIYLHCWDKGDTVAGNNKWWHVRRAGTQEMGWVSDEYVYGYHDTDWARC
ncbi:hypothetical protein [Streptomyces roseifaciens]|uniref:hypothetical protein n=1 Tax=Streptomyces roseifaciens TaxID=1488406 RepID=UPI000717EFC5|nr:hypothetical protein [Streptomyces roseifaciens]